MNFFNPEMLIGILAGVVPVLIYFLIRRKVREVAWAAMQYLFEIYQEKKKRNWLEILQIVLRVALLVFLALALARPGFGTGAGGDSRYGSADEVLLLLDNTFSMGLRQGAGNRLGKAQEVAGEIISGLPASSSVALVCGSENPEMIVREFTRDQAMVGEIVRNLKPSAYAGSAAAFVDGIEAVLKNSKSASRKVFVISDFQAIDWQKPDPRLITRLREVSERNRIEFIPITDGITANCSVKSLSLPADVLRKDRQVNFTAVVVNHDAHDVTGLPVELLVDESVRSTVTVDVPAGGQQEVLIPFIPSELGMHRAVFRIKQDLLEADNSFYLPFRVVEEVSILGVVDLAGAARGPHELIFVDYALNPYVGGGANPEAAYRLRLVSATDISAQRLEDYEMVFISGVAAFTESEAAQIADYVHAGGGVFFFLNANVRPNLYNKVFHEGERKLFPWPLQEQPLVRRDAQQPLQFRIAGEDSPIMRGMTGAGANYFDGVQMFSAWGFTPGDAARAAVLGEAAGDEGGMQPVITMFRHGRGNALVFGSSADLSQNNFPLRPVYVAFINRSVDFLRSARAGERMATIGARLSIAQDFKRSQATFTVSFPDGDGTAVSVREQDGGYFLNLPELSRAGFYRVGNEADEADTFYVAANVNIAEGQVAGLSAQELAEVYAPLGIDVFGSAAQSGARSEARSFSADLTWLFLLLALLCLLGENFVGYRISTQC